jgi:hypothetical protein
VGSHILPRAVYAKKGGDRAAGAIKIENYKISLDNTFLKCYTVYHHRGGYYGF